MDNTVSSIRVFSNSNCAPPPPEMTLELEPIESYGVQATATWSGASDGWQMIYWGDGWDYGVQGPSGSVTKNHWYPEAGTYTVTFRVENTAPDWSWYYLTQEVTVRADVNDLENLIFLPLVLR